MNMLKAVVALYGNYDAVWCCALVCLRVTVWLWCKEHRSSFRWMLIRSPPGSLNRNWTSHCSCSALTANCRLWCIIPTAPTTVLMAIFQGEDGLAGSSRFRPLLVMAENLWDERHKFFSVRMFFLSSSQRCQETEWNSKHWPQPVACPHPFFVLHWSPGHCYLYAGFLMPVL